VSCEGRNRARFAKAFVGGLTATDREAWRLPRVAGASGEAAAETMSAADVALYAFGDRAATLRLSVSDGMIYVKGRPFWLHGSCEALGAAAFEGCLAALDGRFSLCAIFADSVWLATDILGAGPIFYHVDRDRGLLFSTHLGLLIHSLPQRPALDQLGVVAMIAGSCSVGGRTAFDGIRRLEAGQFLVAARGRSPLEHRVGTYVDVVRELTTPQPGSQRSLDDFEELFVAAVDREAVTADHALMLSGGKDSQAIALAHVLRGRTPIRAFTFGEPQAMDVRGARQFAHEFAVDHTVIDYSNWTFESYAELIVALSGGSSGVQTASHVVAYERLADRVPLAMVGYLGDALTGAHLPRDGQTIADPVLPFRGSWHPSVVEEYSPEWEGLQAMLESRWPSYADVPLRQRAMLTDLLVRQATWISATFDLCDWFVPLSFPLFSRSLIQFCLNLPEPDLVDQSLYRRWLARSRNRTMAETRGAKRQSSALLQPLLHRLDRFRGKRQFDLLDWKKQFDGSKSWLRRVFDEKAEARLRRVMLAQIDEGYGHYPSLLAAGVVLASH
jgi:Asparagine synthase